MKDSHRTDGIGRLLARCGRVSLLAAGCIGVVLVLLVAVLFGILGVCLLFPGWRASWLPGVLLLGVCAVVAWLAIMAARGVLRWFRKPVAPCDVSPPPLPGICPACGEADLYRAAGSTALPWSIFTARCVSCASRFRVPRRLWIALPEANPRAPHETFEDRVREREGSFDRQLRVAPNLWD